MTARPQGGNESLSQLWVAVFALKSTLLYIWVHVTGVVLSGTAGERHVGLAIPGGAGEGGVDGDAAPIDDDGQVAMDIDQALRGNGPRSLLSEQLPGPLAVDSIHAMNDLRFTTGQKPAEPLSEEEMLGGTGTSTLPHHRLDAAVARAPVVQSTHGFDQIDQRGIGCG